MEYDHSYGAEQMINHALCLLINKNRNEIINDVNKLYIDKNYETITNLPTYIIKIRNILFGTEPDEDMLFYRARQYLQMIHADKELEKFITDFDNRITYNLDNSEYTNNSLFGMKIISGPTDYLFILGQQLPPDWQGKLKVSFSIVRNSNNEITIEDNNVPKVYNINFVDNQSQPPAPLGNTGYYVSIHSNASVGTSWEVRGLLRPLAKINEIINRLENLDDSIFIKLFSDPHDSKFKNLWYNSKISHYRLCGIILTLIYKMQDLINNK